MKSHTYYLGLIAFGGIAVAIYSLAFSGFFYAYNPDSAAYIEAARSLLAGHGMMITPSLGAVGVEQAPFVLWPPGFPALIAALSTVTGLPPEESVLWITRGASAILPAAIAFATRPIAGTAGAAAIAILVLTSPFTLQHGYLAMSDVPFLLGIALSLGLLLRAGEANRPMRGLIASGLVAGLAYSLRNAGLAFFVGVIAAFAVGALLRVIPWRQAAERAAWWLAGLGIGIAPTWIHNLMLAGEFSTYRGGAGGNDPVMISRSFLSQLFLDTSGSRYVSMLAWDAKAFLLLVVPVVALLAFGLFTQWKKAEPAKRFGILVTGFYLATGSSMVLIAATIWLGGVDARLLLQYSWLVLVIAAFATGAGQASANRRVLALSALVFVALLGGRLNFLYEDFQRQQTISGLLSEHRDYTQAVANLPDRSWVMRMQLARLYAESSRVETLLNELPPETLLISNMGYIFRIETGRPVRSIYLKDVKGPSALKRSLAQILANYPNRPVSILLTPSNLMLKSAANGDWRSQITENLPPGFEVRVDQPNLLVLGSTHSREAS